MTGGPAVGQVVTYDRDLLHQHLTDIRSYLGELRYLDMAEAYLEQQQDSWGPVRPLGQDVVTIDVTLGRTVPFTRRYLVPDHLVTRLPWQDSKREEIVRHLAVLEREADTWAAANVTYLTERIAPYIHHSPARYDYGVIDPLVRMRQTLEDEVTADFGKLHHSLGHWEGEAADNFATYFYHPFAHTLATHKRLLASLTAAVVTAKAITESTQHSIMTVVSGVREQLLEQLELRATQAAIDRERATRTILVIGAGAASVVGALFSGGLWPVAMATVAAGVSAASTTIPEGAATDLELQGVTAEELLDSFVEAVGTVDDNFQHQQDELADAVVKVLSRLDLLRDGPHEDDGRLIPATPDIVDGVDADTFYLP